MTLALRARRDWTPTAEQEAVAEAVAQRDASVMVEAGAGCAKSTTLEYAAPRVRVPALALAFNKSIAQELAKRLPANFQAKTMNAMGHGAWARGPGKGQTLDLQPRKLGQLVSQIAKDHKQRLSPEEWSGVRETVEKIMQWGVLPSEEEALGYVGLRPSGPEVWSQAASEAGLGEAPDEGLLALAQETLRESIRQARLGTLSFDDQVYCSALLGGSFPQYPVVMVDENQDLSPLNHLILAKCLAASGRLITVGDRHQAIYGFRGAVSQSAKQIRALRSADTWLDRQLLTTFRCPQAVVARQQSHVPGYRAGPGAPKGLVHEFPPGSEPDAKPWGWTELKSHLSQRPSLAILCRNNAPLLRMGFALIRQDVGVQMLGRDIGKDLVVLCQKISTKQDLPLDAFAGRLREWEQKECSLADANDRPQAKARIRDQADCLRAVMDSGSVRGSVDMAKAIGLLFARESGLVTLGSIHRAKGLEWDVVLHLDPWRIGQAIQRAVRQGQDPEQELNLRYVCETRTRHTLLMGSMEDFE